MKRNTMREMPRRQFGKGGGGTIIVFVIGFVLGRMSSTTTNTLLLLLDSIKSPTNENNNVLIAVNQVVVDQQGQQPPPQLLLRSSSLEQSRASQQITRPTTIACSSEEAEGNSNNNNNNSTACKGTFQYDPPNHAPNASTIVFETNKTYTGGQYKIFFPTKSKNATTTTHHQSSASAVEECIQEWKDNQIEYQRHGMSAYKEDMIIFDAFFRNRNNDDEFFYMEIGGHNGVLESNTRFYDVCLGWEGLLVEPTPRNYERMIKLRPNAHHLNVAPSCNTSDVVMFPDHWYTNAVMNEEGATLAIHCGPLSYYLEQLDITHISYWSLDVEGAELSVLQTVDFNAVQIDVIMAESENRLVEKEHLAQDVRSFLQTKDYILMKSVAVHKSDIFLHKSACVRYDNFPECQNL